MGIDVVWTRQALSDLDQIEAFISQDSPFNAETVVSRLLAVATSIADQPLMGRVVPEFQSEMIRERIVYSYRLIYRRLEARAEIIAVIHGRRVIMPIGVRL